MKDKQQQTNQSENTLTEIFKYEVEAGVSEYHVMIHATRPEATYEEQLNAVVDTYCQLRESELQGAVAIFKRYFLSDAANQADMLLALSAECSDCALSVVEQPPLNGTKIALWVYLQKGVETQVLHNGLFEVRHGAYRHLWGGGSFNRAANSEYQTRLLLNDYVMQLMEQGCKLADNCIRTWFFVQNVDVNYTGVVKARNEVFVTQDLTEKTHYISSTGIGGRHADPTVTVQMDTYAVDGLKSAQIHYLYAPTHLNPPYDFCVQRPEDVIFTNTFSPFTNLSYYKGGGSRDGEERFKSYFAINANKRLGFGFYIDYLYGRGLYQDQSTAFFNGGLFSSYRGDKYDMHFIFNNDNLKMAENGGITDDR